MRTTRRSLRRRAFSHSVPRAQPSWSGFLFGRAAKVGRYTRRVLTSTCLCSEPLVPQDYCGSIRRSDETPRLPRRHQCRGVLRRFVVRHTGPVRVDGAAPELCHSSRPERSVRWSAVACRCTRESSAPAVLGNQSGLQLGSRRLRRRIIRTPGQALRHIDASGGFRRLRMTCWPCVSRRSPSVPKAIVTASLVLVPRERSRTAGHHFS
jgi:hypothetical protein